MFITGDTHIPIDIHKLSTNAFPDQKKLSKSDYVLVCGDFGGVWDNSSADDYWLNWLDSKNFTTLFIDGNHENFDLLEQYPVTSFCGGKVHQIRPSVYHLMRGQVFMLCGRRVFTMGGARSTDMPFRKPGISWWPQEIPSRSEMEEGYASLNRWEDIDLVVTHDAPERILKQMHMWYPDHVKTSLDSFLRVLDESCTAPEWYFGHYHTDCDYIEPGFRNWHCRYNRIDKIC